MKLVAFYSFNGSCLNVWCADFSKNIFFFKKNSEIQEVDFFFKFQRVASIVTTATNTCLSTKLQCFQNYSRPFAIFQTNGDCT